MIRRLLDSLTATAADRMRGLAWTSLVANLGLVLTGGAVRLTGSGLGCPTWPRCTEDSFTPHGALTYHSAIEFGNRMLTFVLVAVAVATFLAALGVRRRDDRPDVLRLALILALGVPAQAVVGGVTVLTDLNPWVVSFHLLVSLAMVGVAVTLIFRVYRGPARHRPMDPAGALAWLAFAVAWAVLYLGTVVTGSGPHAGDAHVARNGIDPLQISQVHADLVFLLVGLTVALVVLTRHRAAIALLGVELAQGLVGFVQYFTDLPVGLVALHLVGSGLTSAAVTWTVLETRAAQASSSGSRGNSAAPLVTTEPTGN